MNTFSVFCLLVLALQLIQCTSQQTDTKNLNFQRDTTQLIQAVLNDEQLKSEIKKDFGDQPLKLIANPFVKSGNHFVFANRPIEIVTYSGNFRQIRELYPKKLYVSINQVKYFPNDSANVFMIFHAGNATALFYLKKQHDSWKVNGRQYGKF